MKKLLYLFPFLFFGCFQPKKQTPIDIKTVHEAYIKKELYGKDSIQLNQERIKLFTQEWNQATSEGPRKMISEFWVTFKLKDSSIRRFKTNKGFITENNDWAFFSISDSTLIQSWWNSPLPYSSPKDFTPLSFIKRISTSLKTEKDTLFLGILMVEKFPIDWVKKEHLEPLFLLLDSKESSGCFFNPHSSYLPNYHDSAEKGGYAAIFIKAFMEKKKVDLGLYSCPKVDNELNKKLRKWWKDYK
ncbi:hypothetical protein [Pseudotenacibaculum haliotis]|uniref:Lipoprotein n=1 Tax=Pseudotenacibaculum haliotis TaxID=1862138 RepID=A0ABW5LVU4_9FLAO